MDLFLNSLSQEVCDLTQSAARAERSHSQLQDEYVDLQHYTRNQLIQSSLALHIPNSKSSKNIANSLKNQGENLKTPQINSVSGVNSLPKTQTIRKSKIKPKSQRKIYNSHKENIPALNRPYKTHQFSSTTNPIRPQLHNPNEINQFNRERHFENQRLIKTLNLNQQKQQSTSQSKQDLKLTQRSNNLNSSRHIVPAHPFIISPALGGDGYDYQDYNHFTEMPSVHNERRTGLKKAKSPFFARVFSETSNPNCPPDSPMRRPKDDKIDFNVQVF